MENEKSVVEEYLNRGGFAGYAHSILADEFHKAESDKTHILWPVISLLNRKQPVAAAKLFAEILMSNDLDISLRRTATFVEVTCVADLIIYAEQNFDDSAILDTLPIEIIRWAGIGVGLRESKAAGGRKKGKTAKNNVIQAWESSGKKQTIPAFAGRYFETNGGCYNAEDVSEGKCPTVRTIEKYVREHEKNSTVF